MLFFVVAGKSGLVKNLTCGDGHAFQALGCLLLCSQKYSVSQSVIYYRVANILLMNFKIMYMTIAKLYLQRAQLHDVTNFLCHKQHWCGRDKYWSL